MLRTLRDGSQVTKIDDIVADKHLGIQADALPART